jgi:5,10-methylenetetrahydromethanopterin reductase
MELWTLNVASPRGASPIAQQIEARGWDGLVVVDSQNLSGDCYIALAMAASVTERIGLGPGVTNSVTRQAAVTAGAIASIQSLSRGRAVLGIGRGDSALAHLGRAPAKLPAFEIYLKHLKAYLSGNSVAFDEIEIPPGIANPVADLKLSGTPQESRIGWIEKVAPVPLEIAATGPKVIAMAARHADRIMFTLGADPERLSWGIETARQARVESGLDPDELRMGAYINLACDSDQSLAREQVKGGLTTFSRFSVMHGRASGPVSDSQREVLQSLRDVYDMRRHTQGDSPQAGQLTPEFIDQFAIAGSPEYCIERMNQIRQLGIDKIIISGPVSGRRDGEATLFEKEVLKQFVGVR